MAAPGPIEELAIARGRIKIAPPKPLRFRSLTHLESATRKTEKGTRGALTKFGQLLAADLNSLDNSKLADDEVVQFLAAASEIMPAVNGFLARNRARARCVRS